MRDLDLSQTLTVAEKSGDPADLLGSHARQPDPRSSSGDLT
jgi:hypothetical protein